MLSSIVARSIPVADSSSRMLYSSLQPLHLTWSLQLVQLFSTVLGPSPHLQQYQAILIGVVVWEFGLKGSEKFGR
jgi:hypothetical protein